jgi:hypothetical protein
LRQPLDEFVLANADLLRAFWRLAWYQEGRSGPPRRVNYAALDVEELGTVYESLLDFHPAIDHDSTGRPTFRLDPLPAASRCVSQILGSVAGMGLSSPFIRAGQPYRACE